MDSSFIKGVAHLGLRIFDLERSRAFYEKLGFEFILGPVGPEPVALMLHASGVEINFVINGAEPATENILQDVDVKYAGYTHVALEVSSIDEAVAHLEKVGIPIKSEPVLYPHGASGLFLRDPDFNTVELYQRAPSGSATGDE
jgi:lactoylglutathione lyase